MKQSDTNVKRYRQNLTKIRTSYLEFSLAVAKSLNIDIGQLLPAFSDIIPQNHASLKELPSPQLLTVERAAEKLGLSKGTLNNWRLIGKGPKFHKIGHRCFYHENDIAGFISNSSYSSTSQYDAVTSRNTNEQYNYIEEKKHDK